MINITKINAIAELSRLGWDFKPSSSNEVKCLCPVHEDKNPSVSLNIEKNVWICHASQCKASGDIIALLAYIGKVERKTILADLSSRYPDLKEVKSIKQDRIEKYHQAIWDSGPFINELYKRGVTDDDIRDQRLGYNNGRIMIPIFDLQRRVINIRKYLPGAPGNDKMQNMKGYNVNALYMPEQLKYPTVWICGGEIKALVAKRFLNKHNIGAVAFTGAEGAWHDSLTPLLKNKIVFICFDVDAGGQAGSRRLATLIYTVSQSVSILTLPLDSNKFPKGDINDWVVSENAGEKDFISLMTLGCKFIPPQYKEDDDSDDPINCKLVQAARAENVNKKIQCRAVIAALNEVPFLIPRDVEVSCTRDQPFCSYCIVNTKIPDNSTGRTKVKLKSINSSLLNMVHSPQSRLKPSILEALKVPDCKSAEVYPISFYNVIDVRLGTPLEIDSDNNEYIIQPAFIVTDKSLELNVPYEVIGKTFPDPKNSQAILLINNIDEKEDNLSSFKFNETDLDSLKIFQPEEWSFDGIEKKLDDLYDDLSFNVTRIFQRQDLHLVIDLTYHSVLYFNFEGRQQHGWVNCIIAGDTSQGKTEASTRLMDHYRLGVRYDCKNATKAGLLGGLQQMGGTKWFVTWGIVPIHDKQLVIMEEIKGASPEILGTLTDMRSSGLAEIVGIERRKAHARTRLIMISNPRTDKSIDSYTFGIETIKELMGNLEDIRRFDFALIVSKQEINTKIINQLITDNQIQNPKYSSEVCKKLILWAWTCKPEDIEFEEGAEKLCLKLSNKLCSEFSETLPLCDKGTMRHKLARLAISLACRTFSNKNNGKIRFIRKCHVEFIYKFLMKIYSTDHCGYKNFSITESFIATIRDENAVRKALKESKHRWDLYEQLLHNETIDANDLRVWCEIGQDKAMELLSLLVRERALFKKDRFSYEKSSSFIKLLKNILENKNNDIESIDNIDESSEF